MRHLLYTLLCLLLLLTSGAATADVTCHDERDKKPWLVGEIREGDLDKLVGCLSKFVSTAQPIEISCTSPDKCIRLTLGGWLLLDSQGGDAAEAMRIGRFVRESLASVQVVERCLSACFLVFAASVNGKYLKVGDIGIHRVFFGQSVRRQLDSATHESEYNKVRRAVRDYLYAMDVPNDLVETLFSTSSSEMYLLTSTDLKRLRDHPAYEEWIAARCGEDPLTPDEHRDLFRFSVGEVPPSTGYRDYLYRSGDDRYHTCTERVRWQQFKTTIARYAKESNVRKP